MPDLPLRDDRVQVPATGLRGLYGPYLAHPDLVTAANVALSLEMPLLLTGEPGCGKTDFAYALADAVDPTKRPLECWVRSDSQARDLLYRYDTVQRFSDAQHPGGGDPRDPRNYIELQALGLALVSERRRVVLIDEIDKAPRDLPNDLLRELDQGHFTIPELRRVPSGEPVRDPHGVELRYEMRRPDGSPKPLVVITSNVERQLPDPFLRRCVFYHIDFPDEERLAKILRARFEVPPGPFLEQVLDIFVALRAVPGLVKKPSTSELLNWTEALLEVFHPEEVREALRAYHQALGDDGLDTERVKWPELPGLSCLLKLREDLETVS